MLIEEATLLVVENGQDSDGFPIESITEIPVYCREKSVKYTEFYEAMRSGYRPRVILEMRIEDWEQSRRLVNGKVEYATRIEYDGGTYDVYRSYKKDRDMIQITCG